MIDKAIIYSVKHIGLWDEQMSKDLKAGKISRVYVDIPTLKAAIYEIGLEVIGKDEVEEDDSGGKYKLNKYLVAENRLRRQQRKAWAKACGVAE